MCRPMTDGGVQWRGSFSIRDHDWGSALEHKLTRGGEKVLSFHNGDDPIQ